MSLGCRGEHRDHEIRETPHVVVEKTLRDERLSGRGTLEPKEAVFRQQAQHSRISAVNICTAASFE